MENELIFTRLNTLIKVVRDATDKVIKATWRAAKDHRDSGSEGTGERL